jgi:hypothetical protein
VTCMSNLYSTCASNPSLLKPKTGLAQYVGLVFPTHDAYWNAAAIHGNYGDSDKLLEFDELTLGTM